MNRLGGALTLPSGKEEDRRNAVYRRGNMTWPDRVDQLDIGGGWRLRPWRASDAKRLAELVDGDPAIARWIPAIPQPYGEPEAAAFIERAIAGWEAGTDAEFAIVDAADAPAGAIGLHLVRDAAPSVGYWVAEAARGAGLASRAAEALARFAVDSVGVERVILNAQPANRASVRVAEKAGFRDAGRTVLGDGLPRRIFEWRPPG
jgi:RimJ/RimL family protein N-acetyltransferase